MQPRVTQATAGLIALTGLAYAMAYLRDVAVAAIYGAGLLTDALFAGTMLPMLVYTVVLAGALGPAFLTLYGRSGSGEGGASSLILSSAARRGYAGTIVAVFLLEVSADQLVALLAPGFGLTGSSYAAQILRLSAPMLLFLAPAVLAGTLLNIRGDYLLTGLGSFIFGAAMLVAVPLSRFAGVSILPVSMVVGAALQLAMLLRHLEREERSALIGVWRPVTRSADKSASLGALLIPALSFVAVAQVLLIVERAIASGLGPGVLSYLAYAYKLYSVPVTVVATSLAVVLGTQVAALGSGNRAEVALLLEKALVRVTILLGPVAVWLLICGMPFVQTVFQRGNFSARDAASTSQLLWWYLPGLLPAAYALLIARASLAAGAKSALLWSGVAQVATYLFLVHFVLRGAVGLAASMSVSSVAGCVLLYLLAAKKLGLSIWRLGISLLLPLRIVAAVAAAGWITVSALGSSLAPTPTTLAAGAASVLAAAFVYPLRPKRITRAPMEVSSLWKEKLLWK